MAPIDQSMITIVVTEEQLQAVRDTGTVQIGSSGALQITLRMAPANGVEQEAQEEESNRKSSAKRRHSSAESEVPPSKKQRSAVPVTPPAGMPWSTILVRSSPRTKNPWT
jgi:hypothetical protein